jgi:outer membrane protein W
LGVMLAGMPLFAAEIGRRPITKGSPEVSKTYNDIMSEGTIGIDLAFGWNSASWKIGDGDSNSQNTWLPQAAIFYGMNEHLDIRLAAKFLSLEDENKEGVKQTLDMTRIGIGGRYLFSTETDFMPYITVLINYYIPDSDNLDNLTGTFGLAGDIGVAYQVTDSFLLNVGLQAETFLGKADGIDKVTGEDEQLSFSAYGIGIGATVLF